jgi:transposase, IS30 family
MKTRYSHLSSSDRHIIEVFVRLGATAAAIARFLGRHRATVCREIARARAFKGSFKGSSGYMAHFGELHAQRARRRAGLARRKLGPDPNSAAWLHVRQGLAAGLSPQIIAGRLARCCQPTGSHLQHPAYVSHETIYCALYALPRGSLRSELISQLCRSRSGRRPRRKTSARSTRVQEMTPIALRPPEVAARIVPGHWEGDLIKGAGGRSAIGTLVERSSRYILLVRLKGCSAGHILEGFTQRLRSIPAELRRTLTYDQGSEMAMHKTLSKRLRMDIFFCDAYKPWQRGSNENANGLIRRYLPKGVDLSAFTAQDLAKLEYILNNRPRKILAFATPQEVFSQLKLKTISGVALQA